MSAVTGIEWTDRTWLTAAKRAGISLDEYRANVEAGLKHCWCCHAWKAVDLFGIDRSRSDGRAARCTPCRRKPKQLRLIRPTPAEDARLRYATDPEHRFRRRQHSHSRKRGVDPMSPEGAENLLEWTGGLCLYCDAPATTWDHIVPISKGGQTEPGNMAPACVSCNSRKRDRNVNDFIERYDIPVTSRLEGFIALALEGRLL